MTPYSYFPKGVYNYNQNSVNKSQRPIYDVPGTPAPIYEIPEPIMEMPPQPINNILYTQGYLKANIGRYIKAEFLIGTTSFMDREGILKEVGISYFIIQEPETDDLVLCDMYSLKFVRFFY